MRLIGLDPSGLRSQNDLGLRNLSGAEKCNLDAHINGRVSFLTEFSHFGSCSHDIIAESEN